MPLSKELREKLVGHTGAAETATDDDLVIAAASTLDAQKSDMAAMAGKATKVTALSADLEKVTKERDTLSGQLVAAKADVQAKAAALALSAESVEPPIVVKGLSEVANAKWKQAIAAGFPAIAVDAIKPLFRKADGRMNAIALSACPSVETDGTVSESRLELQLADWATKLVGAEFGLGVKLGLSGDPTTYNVQRTPSGAADVADPVEVNKLRKLSGLPATS